jgi:hypothetical protein
LGFLAEQGPQARRRTQSLELIEKRIPCNDSAEPTEVLMKGISFLNAWLEAREGSGLFSLID